MRKTFTLLFAALLTCVGVVKAENVLFNAKSTAPLPGTLTEGQYHWKSSEIIAPENFKTLRLTFTKNTNNALSYGYPHVAIAEFYLYDAEGAVVALAEANFNSNATEPNEGSVAELCDGSTSKQEGEGDYAWYWHSYWSATADAYHYLEINVSEISADLSTFTIGYVTRQSNGSPAEILVTTGTSTEDVAAQCPNVTVTYNQMLAGENKKTEACPAVVGASFPAYSLPWGVKTNTEVPAVVTADATIDLEVVYNTEELPFVPSTSYEEANWYYLHLNENKQYIRYNAEDTYIPMGVTSVDQDIIAYAWAFAGNPYEGYKLMNRKAGSDKILSASKNVYDGNTGGNTYPLVKAESEIDDSSNKSWIIAKSSDIENGMYIGLTATDGNTVYMNDRGKLAFWTGGQGKGSTFTVEEFSFQPALTIAKDNAVKNLTALANSSVICASADVEATKAEVEAITLAGDTEADYTDALAKLNDCMNSLVGGKFFTINNVKDNSVYLSTDGGKAISTNTADINAYWTLKSANGMFHLYNKYNNAYLQAVPDANETIINATADVNSAAGYKVILPTETDNVWALTSFENAEATVQRFVHKADDGRIVRWDAQSTTTASHWTVASVDYAAAFAALVDAQLEGKIFNDTPALGEYPTSAKEEFEALKAAYIANPTEENEIALVNGIAALDVAKNRPIFTIDGVIDYAAGKSIYDDNDAAPNFKATNVYDKTMWWALDMTTTTVEAIEEVGIFNVGTGNGFWGVNSIKVTETSENDGAGIPDDGIFLFYTTGNETPLHFQNSGQVIVRYGSKEATSGSAVKFTYLGNSYDLDKLTDEHITARAGLQATYDANKALKDVTIGTAPGEYTGDKDALVAALTAAEAILAKSLTELAAMEVAAIEAAGTAIEESADGITYNLPAAGKYYTIEAVAGWNDDAPYLGSKNSETKAGRAEFVEVDDATRANIIFYFDGTTLQNYATKAYLVNNNNFLGYSDGEVEASKVAFQAASNGFAKAYNISFNDGTRWLYCHQDNYTDAGGSIGNNNGYCFILTEVAEEELPTAIEQITTTTSTAIYDLTGRRVEKMEKGIYIVNGKKVLVK